MEYVISNVGSRIINEDSYKVCDMDDGKLYLIADGCGGHGFGEIASNIVTDSLPQLLAEDSISEESVINAIKICNVRVLEKQNKYRGMRTTIVGMFKNSSKVIAFNVGDSRLYQIRNGEVLFVSEDQSVTYLLYKAGIISFDEINVHEDRNKILEALGNKDNIKINTYVLDFHSKDVFVLATDGFWENISKDMWAELTPGNEKRWLDICIQYIEDKHDIEQDNYTVIVVGDLNE